jgi:acid phosphatase (class A)
MRKAAYGLVALLVLLIGAPASAHDFIFLKGNAPDLSKLLAPPPAPDSEAQRRDLAAVLKAQAERTPEQSAAAVADNAMSVERFADAVGAIPPREKLPATVAFFTRINHDSRKVVVASKDVWNRPRPFVVSPEIHFIGAKPGTIGSYPSGHSIFGYLTAIMLGEMLPEKRAALFARGRLYGEHRVIAGVHFPSDVEAGRISATVIAAALMASPDFAPEFNAAKKELREALGLPPLSP